MSRSEVSRLRPALVIALLTIGLAGCQTFGDAISEPQAEGVAITSSVPEPTDLKYFPSSEPLRHGLEQFKRGNLGLAEQYFRDAVEKSPENAAAWIGLAASYDHIKRFELADRAYRHAIRLSGETTQILNNQGYSYMLRGDYKTAQAKLQKAYRREPTNITIINNLEILHSTNGGSPRPS